MIHFYLNGKRRSPLTVLCLGSHADDIEIGCGGTLLKLTKECDHLAVHWVVFSATPEREREAIRSAGLFLKRAAKKHVAIEHFKDSYFPFVGKDLKDYMQELGRRVKPDLIFTHHRNDLHQDHRLISELTWTVFRDHLILEFEIPKFDGDLEPPNVFVPLEKSLCRRKVQTIADCFVSQRNKHWFSEETFFSLLRLRGIESRSRSTYAEAFHCKKMLLL